MVTVPFVHVNNDGKGLMLNSDITLSNPTKSADASDLADQIRVWTGNSYDTFFFYAGDGDQYAPGWVFADEYGYWPYMEETEGYENGLPEGTGVFVKLLSGSGKALTGSGAVENEAEYEVPLASGKFTMTGNPYPTALKLNDAKQVSYAAPTKSADASDLADQIRVWTGNSYDTFFYYAGDGDQYAPGWVFADEYGNWPYMEETEGYENGLPAGTGFFFKALTGSGKNIVFKKTF